MRTGNSLTRHSPGPTSPTRWGNADVHHCHVLPEWELLSTRSSCSRHTPFPLHTGIASKFGEGVKRREWDTATETEKQHQTRESAPRSTQISSTIQTIKNAASQAKIMLPTISQGCNKAGRLWDHKKHLIIMKIKNLSEEGKKRKPKQPPFSAIYYRMANVAGQSGRDSYEQRTRDKQNFQCKKSERL